MTKTIYCKKKKKVPIIHPIFLNAPILENHSCGAFFQADRVRLMPLNVYMCQ